MYPRIPDPPVQGPLEPTGVYGLRLVHYLLADGAVACLTLEQCKLAGYSATYASTLRDYPAPVYRRLSSLKHELAAAVRRRQVETTAGVTIQSAPVGKAREGPGAPLSPVPRRNPPVGAFADISF